MTMGIMNSPHSPGAPTVGFRGPIDLHLVGGPTVLMRIGGLTIITDPTFDPPGDHPVGHRTLVKSEGPALAAEDLPSLDVVLRSHEQHPDNLDDAGRNIAARAGQVITTPESAAKLTGAAATGLMPWTGIDLQRPDGGRLRITAVPADHGPRHVEHLSGHVIGFVLSAPDLPTTYVSGDNASLDVVAEVAQHSGPIDVAVLFGGRARSPLMDAYLTLSAAQMVRATEILGARVVVPAHIDGWKHLTEGIDEVRAAFAGSAVESRLRMLRPGERLTI